MPRLTDESIMEQGDYQGYKLANVPAEELLSIWDADGFDSKSDLGRYIEDNLDVLRFELKNNKHYFD